MLSKEQKEKLMQMKIITVAEANALGIDSSCLAYYAKKGVLERFGRGVYRNTTIDFDLPFMWEELIGIVYSIPKAVITGISALHIYGITDQELGCHSIAIPNDVTIGKRPHLCAWRLRTYDLGITKIKLGDVEVPIYDIERVIVDAFRFYDDETAIKALQYGFKLPFEKRPRQNKLSEYSRILHGGLRPYIMALTT